MAFSSSFIKKKNKQWHYYPFGTVMQDISMPIKNGRKETLIQSLDNEMNIAIYCLLPIVLLGMAHPLLPLLGLAVIPYLIRRRQKTVKENCEFIKYPFSIFIKNYFKIVYFYIDEDDLKNRKFIGNTILFFSAILITAYFQKGSFLAIRNSDHAGEFLFLSIMVLLSLILYSVMHFKKWQSNRHKHE